MEQRIFFKTGKNLLELVLIYILKMEESAYLSIERLKDSRLYHSEQKRVSRLVKRTNSKR
jgi:hypothetical protein